MQSIAFARCVGVFEGGGVRGAAFAGAYRAAARAGIEFVGTVGASSGSIAAVLIAAGFDPEDVHAEMKKNFVRFLAASTPPQTLFKRGLLTSSKFHRVLNNVAAWQLALGQHSSVHIHDWLNSLLRKKLPRSGQTVLFKDIPKPVAVVAADLLTRGPKVYSLATTPLSSVGFAVRASCSIPFFFQPVEGESSFLVDGGVLANLPVFLVNELKLEENLPTLCFRLTATRPSSAKAPGSGIEMLRALINTILNGATEIHLSMGKVRQVINIDTGEIDSTDFHINDAAVNFLVDAGEKAVNEFVTNEQVRVAGWTLSQSEPLLGYREGLLDETAQLISNSTGEIWILGGDLSWFRDLYIAIVQARLRNRPLKILCESCDNQAYKEAIAAAVAIGAFVIEIKETLPIRATIVSPETDRSEMIAIEKDPKPHGRRFQLPVDKGFITLVKQLFTSAKETASQIGDGRQPVFRPIPPARILQALREGVPAYRELPMEIKSVPLRNLGPLPRYLERFKLARAAEVEKLLSEQGLPNSACVESSPWPITPPVVELLKDKRMVIIDGAHRIYNALFTLNCSEMRVVVVENLHSNLPASPFSDWRGVQIVTQNKPRHERYENFNESAFRPIRDAFKILGQS